MLRACQGTNQKGEEAIDDDRELLSMSIKSIKVERNVYIVLELDTLLESCSTHLSYLATAFIVEAYVILY